MTDKPNTPASSTSLNTTPLKTTPSNTVNVSDTNTATTADKNANSIGSRADTETLLDAFSDALPNALDLDPDDPEHGLATLVLAVVELLRELLERQAIRRMEHGNLSDAEIERLGDAFYRLKHKVDELKEVFGVTNDDLDLGFLEQYL